MNLSLTSTQHFSHAFNLIRFIYLVLGSHFPEQNIFLKSRFTITLSTGCREVARTPANFADGELFNNS